MVYTCETELGGYSDYRKSSKHYLRRAYGLVPRILDIHFSSILHNLQYYPRPLYPVMKIFLKLIVEVDMLLLSYL